MSDPSVCGSVEVGRAMASAEALAELQNLIGTGTSSSGSGALEKMPVEAQHDREQELDAQMNLHLCQTPPIDLPRDMQRELAEALADLLWNAAVVNDPSAVRPTGDE